jgi:hypothetical protein
MSFTVGLKKASRTRPYLAAFALAATMVFSLCSFPSNATTDSTTVTRIYTRWTETVRRPNPKYIPTTKARQVESEVWALRFGSPGEHQLDVLPDHVDGTPSRFEYHPFRHIDFKEQAYIRKQPAGKTAVRLLAAAPNSSWTLASCAPLRTTTGDRTRLQTAS